MCYLQHLFWVENSPGICACCSGVICKKQNQKKLFIIRCKGEISFEKAVGDNRKSNLASFYKRNMNNPQSYHLLRSDFEADKMRAFLKSRYNEDSIELRLKEMQRQLKNNFESFIQSLKIRIRDKEFALKLKLNQP